MVVRHPVTASRPAVRAGGTGPSADREPTGAAPAPRVEPDAPATGVAGDPRAVAALLPHSDMGGRLAVMRQLNASAGNAAAAGLLAGSGGRRPGPLALQRDDGDGGAGAGGGTGDGADAADSDNPYEEATYTLANSRFAGNKRLGEIANGGDALRKSDPAAAVKPVQTALLDLGYSLLQYKDDGSFGDETSQAIAQFRADRGVTAGEGMDSNALRRLDALAPAPGKQEQHLLDYDRLYGDGKLDVTLAIGYDEGQSHYDDLDRARAWMKDNKLEVATAGTPAPAPGAPDVITGADKPTDPNADTRKGISTPEIYKGKRSVTYPDKSGTRVTKEIAITVTLVPPGTGGKANYEKGLKESEIVFYNGHARRGIGPDFDPDKSPYENFVIGVGSALHKQGRVKAAGAVAESHYVIDKKNDLEAMKDQFDPEKYRVWFFNACSSIAYFDELRGGLLPDKMDRHNLDLFGTVQSVPIAAGLMPVLANLEGILAADTMEGIVQRMATATMVQFRATLAKAGKSEKEIDEAWKAYKGEMFIREGAGDNQVAP